MEFCFYYFSLLSTGTTDYDVRRQRRSPLADSRRSPFRENGNRDSPKRELTPDLKKYKSSIDEVTISKISYDTDFTVACRKESQCEA